MYRDKEVSVKTKHCVKLKIEKSKILLELNNPLELKNIIFFQYCLVSVKCLFSSTEILFQDGEIAKLQSKFFIKISAKY